MDARPRGSRGSNFRHVLPVRRLSEAGHSAPSGAGSYDRSDGLSWRDARGFQSNAYRSRPAAGPDCMGFGPLNRIFHCADGSLFLRAESAAALRAVPGLSGLPDDPAACASALERRFSGGSSADWVRLLQVPGVAARRCRVYSRDPVDEPYARMRGLTAWEYHPGMGVIRTNHCTSRMSLTPPKPGYPSPAPGMDTDWFVKQYMEKHSL